jgi:hypothetical protein
MPVELSSKTRRLSGFGPLWRFRSSGAHFSRVCLARYVALSGFRNLLAPYFSKRRPALFHAGNAFGVPPSRAFPPRQARPLSKPPALLPLALRNGLDSKAFGRTRIRYPGTPSFRLTEARCSPGLSSPPGSSPFSRLNSNEFFLSWACRNPTRRVEPRRPSEYHSTRKSACLSRDCLPSWGFASRPTA